MPEPRLFAVSPPCLQCTQLGLRGPEGPSVVAVGTARAQRAPWLLSAGSAVQALPCPCPRVLPLHPLAQKPQHRHSSPSSCCQPCHWQPLISTLWICSAVPHPSPEHVPISAFPGGAATGCVTPPAMGTAPWHRQILPPALQGWPCHPFTSALQGTDRAGDTLVPTNMLVHTGHPQEAGGSAGPWPRWAAGRGRTQPHWDLWG